MRSHLSALVALLLPLFLFAPPAFSDSLIPNRNLVYDSALKLYWMRDASWIPSGTSTQQTMDWNQSKDWLADLNKQKYGGYDDWYLPTTPDGYYKNGDFVWIYDKDINETKNNVTFSDLGHLYYHDFNLKYGQNVSTISTYPFRNFQEGNYWFGTSSATTPNLAWAFDFTSGTQYLQSTNSSAYAIAVRSGGTAPTPAPEPASALLFLSGITGTLWYLRRKKR